MSFLKKNFSPVGSQSGKRDTPSGDVLGPNIFSYITNDNLAAVKAAGYFNTPERDGLRDILLKHDIIHVSSDVDQANPNSIQFTVIEVATSPVSPSLTNITIEARDINAA